MNNRLSKHLFFALALTMVICQSAYAQQSDERTVETTETTGFVLKIDNKNPTAGQPFEAIIYAISRSGEVNKEYTGEGFSLGGGTAAPDGTNPVYKPLNDWHDGTVTYEVVLYAATGPIGLVASDNFTQGRSDILRVKPGDPDEIVIYSGNGSYGPPGKDVVRETKQAPEVIVFDRWKNPVDGVEVKFENSTNGSVIDARADIEGRQTLKVTKNDGRAACDVWVLGQRYGLNTLEATMRGGTVRSVTFEAHSFWIVKKNLGLIFNVGINGDDLIDVGSYQGGIGGKYFISQRLAYRGLLFFDYDHNSLSTSMTLGNSVEYHFLNGRISPYVGGLLNIGYIKVRGEVDSENWTENIVVPIKVGPLLGFEAVLFDFLSIFIEYQIALEFTFKKTRMSASGIVTTTSGNNFTALTGLGNDAKVGVIVYLNRIAKKW